MILQQLLTLAVGEYIHYSKIKYHMIFVNNLHA